MREHVQYSRCKEMLNEAGLKLSQMLPHMTIGSNKPNPKTQEFFGQFQQTGTTYSFLRGEFFKGKGDNLEQRISDQLQKVEDLAKEINKLIATRKRG